MPDKQRATHRDLIDYISAETGLDQEDSRRVMEVVLAGIVQLSTDNAYLSLRDFGRFSLRYRKQRMNLKPLHGAGQSGEPVVLPATWSLAFYAAPGLVKKDPVSPGLVKKEPL